MSEIDDEMTQYAHEMMPFTRELGLEVIEATKDVVRAQATWAAENCTANGVIHGGYLMSLADSTGATVAMLNLPEGAVTSTIESKTNFFRPVTSGAIGITSIPLHVGRTTIVVQTDVTRDDGKPVTRTTQTQAVIQP
ncbi:MAG TPA: PaaI family thioesterase [Acidimicrobiia bacterium]|nr:PaaI family thioesterase [Acidimicrobiia bacterium]